MEQIYELKGAVTDILSRNNDSRNPKIIFRIKASSGKSYKVDCPFFCPLSIGDGFYGVVKLLDVENVKVIKPPFVQIPIDKDNTVQFFIKSLKGNKFGVVSASKLYGEIESLAKEFRYGADFKVEAAVEESLNVSQTYNAIDPESRYSGDGVIAFLTEYAAEYNNNKNEKVINMLAGKTINKNQARKLLDEWHNKRSFRRLYLLGLTRGEINCSGKNLEELYKICLENPYRIASINYDKCERILNSVGKIPSDVQKDCGKMNRFVYTNAEAKGWMCTPAWALRKALPKYDTYKEILEKEYDIIEVNEKVYTTYNYKVEINVARYTNTLIEETAKEYQGQAQPSIAGKMYECKTLTEEQKRAIDSAVKCKISVVTGGAGVGKSLCIREITRNLSMRGVNYIVAAFTGKAVSRLHEIMKNKIAATIDRHIMKIKERTVNDHKFEKSNIQHIIIDEASMVTTELLYRLIMQIGTKVNFTFIGDCNQLPPIGAGTLMKELMNCGRVPTFYLTQNQRIIPHTDAKGVSLDMKKSPKREETEAIGSKDFDRCILENANALIDTKRSRRTAMEYKEGSGFYIMEGSKETIKTIVSALKQKGCDSDQIAIICPYRAPLVELNRIFQDVYFQDIIDTEDSYMQPTISGGRLWCIGDRVMMTANNYKINVMNGEQGKVVGIEDAGIKVEFEDGVQHLFKFSSGKNPEENDPDDIFEDSPSDELFVDYIDHSFAVSVHKSQGSEYEYVILYIPEDRMANGFLNINLLYTAITRTKRSIWIVGTKATLGTISMTETMSRFDGLAGLLRNMKNGEAEKGLVEFVAHPEFVTGTHLSTAITTIPDSYDSYEDILAMQEYE